jgi:hypothetical protein
MSDQFKYYEIDIAHLLPPDWKEKVFSIAYNYAEHIKTSSYSLQSREQDTNQELESFVVNGNIIKKELPWLYDFYRNTCRDIYHEMTGDEIIVATNDLYAINLNIQVGKTMRYECHIDSNPVQ